MGFLSRLFGGKAGGSKGPALHGKPERDVAALTAPLAVPAIHAVGTSQPTRSQLGGAPLGTSGFIWPDTNGRPLSFLARIDLEELQACHAVDWLPRSGRLQFFYDVDEQPWGFRPDDVHGWKVMHVVRDDSGLSELPFPDALPADQRLARRFLSFRTIRSFPSYEREAVEQLKLSDAESDAFSEIADEDFGGRPRHQLTGYPRPIQGDDMELESQLVSHGVDCGEAGSYSTPRAKALEEGAPEWRLLLQLDSDEAIDVMWGDVGTLYFWVRESDARAARFDRTWLILQCH